MWCEEDSAQNLRCRMSTKRLTPQELEELASQDAYGLPANYASEAALLRQQLQVLPGGARASAFRLIRGGQKNWMACCASANRPISVTREDGAPDFNALKRHLTNPENAKLAAAPTPAPHFQVFSGEEWGKAGSGGKLGSVY